MEWRIFEPVTYLMYLKFLLQTDSPKICAEIVKYIKN